MNIDENVVYLDPPPAPSRMVPPEAATHDSDAAANRLCLAIAEAADDLRRVRDALVLEAEAMRLAMEALERVTVTAIACSRTIQQQRGEPSAAVSMTALARPLGLAASATLAINASIASSGNTLAEISLSVINAGERFVEASRCAALAANLTPPPPRLESEA
jgi:uncharacterized iron-regulated membrane protein